MVQSLLFDALACFLWLETCLSWKNGPHSPSDWNAAATGFLSDLASGTHKCASTESSFATIYWTNSFSQNGRIVFPLASCSSFIDASSRSHEFFSPYTKIPSIVGRTTCCNASIIDDAQSVSDVALVCSTSTTKTCCCGTALGTPSIDVAFSTLER